MALEVERPVHRGALGMGPVWGLLSQHNDCYESTVQSSLLRCSEHYFFTYNLR